MALFIKKPVVVKAITFDEFVQYGIDSGANLTDGMPWSFTYDGAPVTHENDNCYIISTIDGMMQFHRGDMLITGVKGEVYPCKKDIFDETYDPAIMDADDLVVFEVPEANLHSVFPT